VTVALANNPGGGTLHGTLTVKAVNGVADFPDLTVNASGTGYTLRAASGGLGPATTNPFNVTGFTPAQIRSAYGINSLSLDGTGQTIAVVVAYDNPYISQDLDRFDRQFGVAATGPTLYQQYGAASSFLTVLNQDGQAALPVGSDPSGQWEREGALDVEWAHALAPGAKIALIECNGAQDVPTQLDNLMNGVATAGRLGASVVSMSWGFDEGSDVPQALEQRYDGYFAARGVTYLAATGDSGAPGQYPAYSPNVVAVGGTSLELAGAGSYVREEGWFDSGGGTSQYEPEPPYQLAVQSTGTRTIPDVSFDGDPATGVVVTDPSNNPVGSPWSVLGGTSLATPCWAGLIAMVNQGRVAAGRTPLNGPGPTQAQATLYALQVLPGAYFHNNLGGHNGTNTNGLKNPAGYDEVTGLGTPMADLVVPALVNFVAGTTTNVSSAADPSVNGEVVTFTAVVTAQVRGSGPATGAIQFQVDGHNLGSPVGLSGGTATSPGIALATGSHTVTANYINSDGDFVNSSSSLDQEVNPVTSGNVAAVLAAISTVTVDAVSDADLQAIVTAVDALPTPAHPATITVNVSPGTFSDITVSPPPGVTLVIIGNGSATTFVGQSPALTVTSGSVVFENAVLTTATNAPTILVEGGSLALRDDDIEESTGFAQAAVAFAGGTLDLGTAGDPGNNILNLNVPGAFLQSPTAAGITAIGDTFEVRGTPLAASLVTISALASSAGTSVYGDRVQLTATVTPVGPGTPTGTVDFFDTTTNTDLGTEPLGVVDGMAQAVLTPSGLAAGSHSITATNRGDSTFTFSSGAFLQTVTPAPLTITADNQTKVYGAPLPALTASYSGLVNGDTPATFATAPNQPPALATTATAVSPVLGSPYPISVGGAADPDYVISYVNGTLTVTPDATTTAVTSSADPSLLNQAVTFTATVSPVAPGAGQPTGTVQFQVDGANVGSPVTLVNGQAAWTTSSLSAGSHTITAAYSGDSNFLGGSGQVVQAVHFRFGGFLPPLAQGRSDNLGRTLPIKWQLTDADGNSITGLSSVQSLQVQPVDAQGHPLAPPFNPAASGGTGLRYAGNHYAFNWDTKGLQAGSYEIELTLADGTIQTLVVQLG
jgi:hypothetical protein